METRKWLFIIFLAAVYIPITLADDEPSSVSTTSGTVEATTNSVMTQIDGDTTSSSSMQPLATTETLGNTTTADIEEVESVSKKELHISGVRMKSFGGRDFLAFCGIPYAEPPIGQLRFKDTVETSEFSSTNCKETPMCIQIAWHNDKKEVIGSEDCLYLNVYEPEVEATNLPVIVYFHGGGFYSGSGRYLDAGPHYFMDQDVVFVTVNYRLGPFGFFSLNRRDAPGNMGMSDQVMALKWVQKNIKHFHGDKFRVTIMGEGAGGASVHLHLFSPLSRGLFSRAISQSGVAFNSWALMEDMVNASKTHTTILGCYDIRDSNIMKCMRELDADKILEAVSGLHFFKSEPLVKYKPMIQTRRKGIDIFLKEDPMSLLMKRKFRNVPWLVGVVKTPGFTHLKRFFLNDQLLSIIMEHLRDFVPTMLALHVSLPNVSDRAEAMEEIIQFYNLTEKPYKRQLLKMFGDREYTFGTQLVVAYHALLFHEKLFQYRFEYRGKHSMAENFTNGIEDTDVVNEDDLIYLVRRPTLFPDFNNNDKEGKRDIQMMKVLTKIWVDFAATGHVKGMHRTRRDTAALTSQPVAVETEAAAQGIHDYVGNWNPFLMKTPEPDRPAFGLDRWKTIINQEWKNNFTVWDDYAHVMWPAVIRFSTTLGNVRSLPYIAFRRGNNDTPIEYSLRYAVELRPWISIPLKEIIQPDDLLQAVTTSRIETTESVLTTTTEEPLCPKVSPTMPRTLETLATTKSTVMSSVSSAQYVETTKIKIPTDTESTTKTLITCEPITMDSTKVESTTVITTTESYILIGTGSTGAFSWPNEKPLPPTDTSPHINFSILPRPMTTAEEPFTFIRPSPPEQTRTPETFSVMTTKEETEIMETELTVTESESTVTQIFKVTHKPPRQQVKGQSPARSYVVWPATSLLVFQLLILQF